MASLAGFQFSFGWQKPKSAGETHSNSAYMSRKLSPHRNQIRYTHVDPTEPLIDTPTLTQHLGVSPRTIEAWVYTKKIPHLAISSKCVRFRLTEVLRFLEEKHAVHPIVPVNS